MILQTLLFPDARICQIQELYYRRLDERTTSFDTYFNLFSIRKWIQYTNIRNVFLVLDAEGDFDIEISDEHTVLQRKEYCLQTRKKIRIEMPYREDSTAVFFTFTDKKAAHIYGGYYETALETTSKVKLAIGICTYHREETLLKNIEILGEKLLGNDSFLRDQVWLFISDNGRTLNQFNLEQDHISVFPNCNAGGSGGFTRTMIEVLKRPAAERFTHIILMDDDVVIEPDAILRTYALLSLIKDEYRDACIAGAMLRTDLKYVLHENGAVWDGYNPTPVHAGLDLRSRKAVLLNEQIQKVDYAAWWYACYSLDVIKKTGLPLPIFYHGDDVEYGLRAKTDYISLNGISVWHEPFENKRASMQAYYDTRNILLINACRHSCDRLGDVVSMTLRRLIPLILRYRYQDARLLCHGIEDFGKGIDWLKTQDPESLNQKIVDSGYQMKPIRELKVPEEIRKQAAEYKKPGSPDDIYSNKNKPTGAKYIFTINGWILPVKSRRMYAYPTGVWPFELYRKYKILLFDPDTQKGILVQKSYVQAITCFGYYLKTILQLSLKYRKVKAEYRLRFRETTTPEFWKKYLKLETEKMEIRH